MPAPDCLCGFVPLFTKFSGEEKKNLKGTFINARVH